MRADLTSDEHARLDQDISGQVVGVRVNVNTILEGLPAQGGIKNRFAAALAADLPDKSSTLIQRPQSIGVSSAVGEAKVAEKMFSSQSTNLAAVLRDSRVNELVRNRTVNATKRFHFWARLVSVAFTIAAFAAIVAAFAVPHLLAEPADLSPPTTSATIPTTTMPQPPVSTSSFSTSNDDRRPKPSVRKSMLQIPARTWDSQGPDPPTPRLEAA